MFVGFSANAMLPEMTRELLESLAGRELVREGIAVAEAGGVRQVKVEGDVLSGSVLGRSNIFWPRLRFKSTRIADSECNCVSGRRGLVCIHAVALAWKYSIGQREAGERPVREEVPVPSAPPATKPAATLDQLLPVAQPRSLVRSVNRGVRLAARFTLPPNFADAAPRDAILLLCEGVVDGRRRGLDALDRALAYSFNDALSKALALLECWNNGKLPGIASLSRVRLSELLQVLQGEPVVFLREGQGACEWVSGRIPAIDAILNPQPRANPQGAAPGPSALPRIQRGPTPTHGPSSEPGTGPGTLLVDGSLDYLMVRLPSSGSLMHRAAYDLVRNNGFVPDARMGVWFLRTRHKVLNFIAEHGDALRTRFQAEFTPNYVSHFSGVRAATVSVRCEAKAAGVHEIALGLDAGEGTADSLRHALAIGRRFVETDKGVWLLPPKLLEDLAAAQRTLSGESNRAFTSEARFTLSAADLAMSEDLLEELSPSFQPPETWTRRSAALRSMNRLEPAPMAPDLDARLRGYQRLGVAWMWHLYRNSLGGVLADEMGLGKTIQALALVDALRASPGTAGASLVACPASLVENWRRETLRFLPWARVFVHHGRQRLSDPGEFAAYDVVITSYGTLARDQALFARHGFRCVFADEAQHLKNRRTQNAKALRTIRADGRFVLTGTPVENSLDDARSLFEFLLPGYLRRSGIKGGGAAKADERAIADEVDRRRLAPYILRRTKQVVAPELPPRLEQVVFCEMGSVQKKLYEDVRARTERQIMELEYAGAGENRVRFAALTQLLRLRQACADPGVLDETIALEDSAKFAAFEEILDEAMDGGHRILVFSSFVSVLQRLAGGLRGRGVDYCYLDGSSNDRQAQVDRFQDDASVPVFLISLKAGGVGLNLTGADTVVFMDPWWNPAAEAQAADRAHRIGQTRAVSVIKLITAGTIEDRVLELQRAKAEVLAALFEDSAEVTASVSLAEIKELVKRS